MFQKVGLLSEARRRANHRNAQKSTGPRTSTGKSRSRLNRLEHGLRAESVVLPCEDAAEWDSHRQAFRQALDPQDELEEFLVERIALATWRLRRAARCESASVKHRLREAEYDPFCGSFRSRWAESEQALAERKRDFVNSRGCPADDVLARYETTSERSLYRTLEALRRLRAELGSFGRTGSGDDFKPDPICVQEER